MYTRFFFTEKVTQTSCVFPLANFPQEKYFSPSNPFFPKKPIFPTLIQTHSQTERSTAKSAEMHETNVVVVVVV